MFLLHLSKDSMVTRFHRNLHIYIKKQTRHQSNEKFEILFSAWEKQILMVYNEGNFIVKIFFGN